MKGFLSKGSKKILSGLLLLLVSGVSYGSVESSCVAHALAGFGDRAYGIFFSCVIVLALMFCVAFIADFQSKTEESWLKRVQKMSKWVFPVFFIALILVVLGPQLMSCL